MAPPMVMGMTNWTGFYLGANLGGGEADSHYSFTAPLGTTVKHSGDFNLGGPLGGGTTGFNWELSNGFLLGVEGDFDGSGINGSKLCGAGGAYVCGTNSKWLATARGRVGWAPGMGNMLWYVTGGGAWGEIKTKITGPTPAAGNSDSTRSGWTVGGGGEYMLTPQWSLKVEYRYLDLGAKFETANIGLAGLNFHFGAPPPPPPAPMAAPAPPPAAPKVFIVFFDWDKDTITPEGHQIIVQAADAYKAGAPVQIQVTGYTDRSGSPGYNQRLSERRANNVAKAMAALGVPKDQMIVTGRGENDNRVPTAPGVREPQNRRVEIVEP
jgi:outer membrane protein OmpA-like peptidoglycan-associated protein